jgi:hypothetical protein
MVKEQNVQISELLKKLDTTETEYDSKARGKGKKKINTTKPFYHVNIHSLLFILFTLSFIYIYFLLRQDAIKQFATKLFHEHKMISDADLKDRFKSLLESDDHCNSQLKKLEEKNVTFDKLWEEKIYSSVSILIYYYIISWLNKI